MTWAGSEWTPEHTDNFGAPLHTAWPGNVLWLQDIQLLLCTPQKLPSHFKLQPGPESRTATFLWHRAHHPAHRPAPGQLHHLSMAPKQCQNITRELSFFNNRTGGKRTTTALDWAFFPSREKMTGWNNGNRQENILLVTIEQLGHALKCTTVQRKRQAHHLH